MTKKKTQTELLQEISNKLSVVIDQLNNVLNYEPNVVELDTSTEDNSTEVVNNERGDYSGVFGTISEDDFAIIDRKLAHLEIQSNISGVILHYKINNLLNALGVENKDTFFKPNAIYPEVGRMIQFGVTWYFDN